MPDFETMEPARKGLTGLMTEDQLDKINEQLFAKVKREGHIEIRLKDLYNQYGLVLEGSIEIPDNADYTFRIQTHDGLAELIIDDEIVGKGREFANKPEDFSCSLDKGTYKIRINYFYKHIQNQLSILYKTDEMDQFEPFEKLVEPLDIK